MPTNRAAIQDEAGIPLKIRETPYPTSLEPNQLLVKPSAWAINPADHFVQDVPDIPFVTYPVILGQDIAGTVVSAGSSASKKFEVGGRVLAVATGAALSKAEQGGFQEYVVVDSGLACHIPDSMSFTEASVFPLALATPMHGLFSRDFLALPYPKAEQVTSSAQTILVWGGSSAVGSNAIQLATAAGFDVVATSSARNFEYMQRLGAKKVFDYSSHTVVADVVKELDSTDCAGIWQAAGAVEPCLQIAARARGGLLVATATQVTEGAVPEGVRTKMVYGTTLTDNETGPGIFGHFLPKALANGRYKVAPEPLVVGTKGLEGIQEGVDTLRRGVSARKVVVVAESDD